MILTIKIESYPAHNTLVSTLFRQSASGLDSEEVHLYTNFSNIFLLYYIKSIIKYYTTIRKHISDNIQDFL